MKDREKAILYNLMFVILVFATAAMMGCSSETKTLGLGAAAGSGVGASIGAIAGTGKGGARVRNVIVGGAVGGMAGMIAGAVVHEELDRQKKEAFLKGQSSGPLPLGAMPTVMPAQVESRWIEGHPQGGNTWIDGHYEYRITQPAHFEGK